jgi:hypothetical protein
VGSENVKDGAALVFTAPDEIADLRRRALVLTPPGPPNSEGPRLDNIHLGIRLVFEADDPAAVAALRETVHEHARRIAARCGLALGKRTHTETARPKPPSERTPAPATLPKPTRADHGPSKPPDAARKHELPAKPKPKLEPKPKRESAPRAPAAPKDKPLQKVKQRPPKLPGVNPDPVAPSHP